MQGGNCPGAIIQEASEKGRQDQILLTAAIVYDDLLCCMTRQLNWPPNPTSRFAPGELWQSQLNFALRNVRVQGLMQRGAGKVGSQAASRLQGCCWRGT